MTRTEFYEKYGQVEVKFDYYYKYVFTYSGETPNKERIYVDYGGDRDEIYRFELSSIDSQKVIDLQPFAGKVYNSSGEIIESFYDY